MSAAVRLLQAVYTGSSWVTYTTVISLAVFAWALIGLGPYSGYNTPPHYGDFEAQRHWMELTQHLDPKQWYYYDFDWWRLDYPPLTAYHSWLCGIIGSKINPDWFALDSSRGMENVGLKSYMRLTVMISQLLVYAPAMYYWIRSVENKGTNDSVHRSLKLLALLQFPCLAIIDHGHFQYNSVMLGLAMGSMTALVNKRFVIASILFVMSLFFKQMALYYAPVMFMAILSYCVGPPVQWELRFWRLVSVALAVLVTSGILLLPFIDLENWSQPVLQQILLRIFPVFRGLWEDKVANFWCTLNYTVLKLKATFSPAQLQIMALGSTLMCIIPSCVAAFVGKPKVWPWAFASCSWAFFLFSFQVHEKSVLIPLMPTILATIQNFESPNIVGMCAWICNISYFSMWPLLKREGLELQYVILLVASNWLFYNGSTFWPRGIFNKLLVFSSYSAFIAITLIDIFGLVPLHLIARYPDILVVLNMAGSFACFAYFWLWATWRMLTLTTV